MFIVAEGIDGTGKSTFLAKYRWLFDVVLRAPGGPDFDTSRERMWLRQVEPLLRARQTVALDRWQASTLAYQGTARIGPLADLTLYFPPSLAVPKDDSPPDLETVAERYLGAVLRTSRDVLIMTDRDFNDVRKIHEKIAKHKAAQS